MKVDELGGDGPKAFLGCTVEKTSQGKFCLSFVSSMFQPLAQNFIFIVIFSANPSLVRAFVSSGTSLHGVYTVESIYISRASSSSDRSGGF